MQIINSNNSEKRSFRMTIGLEEGYMGLVVHTKETVKKIISDWLLRAKNSGGNYIPGSITESEMLYYSRGREQIVSEPIVLYEGDISPEYNSELTDAVILETLMNLAEIIAQELKQERIYLVYRDHNYILQKRKSE